MKYEQALSYLRGLYSFEKLRALSQRKKGFTLERYKLFLEKIGQPHEGIKYIHVAGSKGKGSVSSFLAAGLRAQNFKTGLFISPAIYDVREQISVNGEQISEVDFAKWVDFLKSKLEETKIEITYFEFVTTLAFFYFKEQKVDFAVLEVGLGGLFDATNVVMSVACVLTQIELEHRDVLGDTVEEVLANKLGIVKNGVPLFVSWQKFNLKKDIEAYAESKNSELTWVYEQFEYSIKEISLKGTQFLLKNGLESLREIALIGEAFVKSVITAFAVLSKILPPSKFDSAKFWQAAKAVKMPGRFEVLESKSGQCIVFDMAHTKEAAKSLRETLKKVFPRKKIIFLISVLQDKDVKEICGALLSKEDKVVFTQAQIPRALNAFDLAKRGGVFAKHFSVEIDPLKAFKEVLSSLQKNEILVVTGSHFLLFDLRKSL